MIKNEVHISYYLTMIQYFRSAYNYSLVFQDVAKFVHLLHGFFNMLKWEWLSAILFIKRPIFLMGVGLHFDGESRNNRIFRSANDHFFQRIPFVISTYWTVATNVVYMFIICLHGDSESKYNLLNIIQVPKSVSSLTLIHININ